ncbi:hypothetical protein, partial [Rodentibacter caecimuris]|uniref:hypothetical protein n=1 Tax=Rodentibacter caecimuris TaxID=1796644 RepID=UPI001C4E217E
KNRSRFRGFKKIGRIASHRVLRAVFDDCLFYRKANWVYMLFLARIGLKHAVSPIKVVQVPESALVYSLP